MDLNELKNRNYQATVKRGLITSKTSKYDFIAKQLEEIHEWIEHPKDPSECADVILVMLAYCKHYKINIQLALEQKTIYNENRKD
jgi:hypothetical protein